MMLFCGPEKRWDYQCTKPRKRKNVFALLYLLLYSRLKWSSSSSSSSHNNNNGRWSRLRYPRLHSFHFDWHIIDRLALPLCVIFIVAVCVAQPTTAAEALPTNVTTNNNTVNYLKDNNNNGNSNSVHELSTSTDLLPGTSTQQPIGQVVLLQTINNGSAGGSASAVAGGASLTAPSKLGPNNNTHRLRYAQHSSGVYSSQLQHLDDEDDYIDDDDDDEEGDGSHSAFPSGHKKRNNTGKSIVCCCKPNKSHSAIA